MNSLELFASVLAWTWVIGWSVVIAVFVGIGKLTNNMPKFKLAPWFTITTFLAVSLIIYNFVK
jgi:hypothetical protein